MTDAFSNGLIWSKRFVMRPLTTDDATERYLQWLADVDTQRYVLTAAKTRSLVDLRKFIEARAGRTDVVFLGIFEREHGEHIGNIKYEPLDSLSGSAEMGLLIGDPAWRGRGAAAEVIAASARWLKENRGIFRIHLGVERVNSAAVAAYARAGFRAIGVISDPRAPSEIVRMEYTPSDS